MNFEMLLFFLVSVASRSVKDTFNWIYIRSKVQIKRDCFSHSGLSNPFACARCHITKASLEVIKRVHNSM